MKRFLNKRWRHVFFKSSRALSVISSVKTALSSVFFCSLSDDEKEALWEKRYYLSHLPAALPLVLASAVGWDWASLNNIYQLIDDWMPLTPVLAIELLLPQYVFVICSIYFNSKKNAL